MTHSNKTLTVKQIRNLNLTIDTVIYFDFQWDSVNGEVHYLVIDNERAFGFSNRKDMINSRKKIRRMNLGWGEVISSTPSDLALGLNEAVRRGENPFAGSIITG